MAWKASEKVPLETSRSFLAVHGRSEGYIGADRVVLAKILRSFRPWASIFSKLVALTRELDGLEQIPLLTIQEPNLCSKEAYMYGSWQDIT